MGLLLLHALCMHQLHMKQTEAQPAGPRKKTIEKRSYEEREAQIRYDGEVSYQVRGTAVYLSV